MGRQATSKRKPRKATSTTTKQPPPPPLMDARCLSLVLSRAELQQEAERLDAEAMELCESIDALRNRLEYLESVQHTHSPVEPVSTPVSSRSTDYATPPSTPSTALSSLPRPDAAATYTLARAVTSTTSTRTTPPGTTLGTSLCTTPASFSSSSPATSYTTSELPPHLLKVLHAEDWHVHASIYPKKRPSCLSASVLWHLSSYHALTVGSLPIHRHEPPTNEILRNADGTLVSPTHWRRIRDDLSLAAAQICTAVQRRLGPAFTLGDLSTERVVVHVPAVYGNALNRLEALHPVALGLCAGRWKSKYLLQRHLEFASRALASTHQYPRAR